MKSSIDHPSKCAEYIDEEVDFTSIIPSSEEMRQLIKVMREIRDVLKQNLDVQATGPKPFFTAPPGDK